MQKNTLIPKTLRKKKKLVGRGGKRGKTAGRGTKGQSARAGNKKRPELRDIIKKLPKLRGYKFNSVSTKIATVNLSDLDKNFNDGDKITPGILASRGIIKMATGKVPPVKILAKGEITKKLIIANCELSASAEKAILDAKGTVKK